MLDFEGVLDYSELIHRAVLLAETDDVRAQLRAQFKAVFVDEYQDTDPSQVRLLQAIAGDGRDLVVVGDPDQSIYAFRGADVRGILEFPTQFPRGRRPPRRRGRARRRPDASASRLLTASRRIAHRHRHERADRRRRPSARSATRWRADGPYGHGQGRRLHVHVQRRRDRPHRRPAAPRAPRGRRAWSEMAVLVRSGVTSIPGCGARSSAPASRSRWRATRCRCARAGRAAAADGAARAPSSPTSTDRRHRADAGHVAAGRPRRRRRAQARPGAPRLATARRIRRAAAALVRRAAARRRWSTRRSSPTSTTGSPRGLASWPVCCSEAHAVLRARRPGRGGALGALGRHPLAPPAARRGRARRCAPRAPPTATSTRSAPCSRWRPAPRRSGSTPAPRTSSTRSRPSRSRPTRWPSGACAATRCGCSPPTGRRGWSGGSSWSPACRRAAGPTCAAAGSLLQADRLGRRRPRRAADHDGDAGRGAPAVLRRRDPGPAAAHRHRGRVARGRRRPAVAARRRAVARADVTCPGRPARSMSLRRRRRPSCAGSRPIPTESEPMRRAAAARLAALGG